MGADVTVTYVTHDLSSDFHAFFREPSTHSKSFDRLRGLTGSPKFAHLVADFLGIRNHTTGIFLVHSTRRVLVPRVGLGTIFRLLFLKIHIMNWLALVLDIDVPILRPTLSLKFSLIFILFLVI